MKYRTLANTGTSRVQPRPRGDGLRHRDRRGRSLRHPRPVRRGRRQPHRHRQRLRRRQRPRSCSAAGSPAARPTSPTASCWPPRPASGLAPTSTRPAPDGATSTAPSLPRCVASAWRRRPLPDARLGPADPGRGDPAASSTTPSAPARSTTSGCPTSPAGSCSSPCPPPRRWGCRSRSPCSSSTAWSAARTSTRSSPPPCTTTSGCCPGPRWPAASSPASTSRTPSRRAAPGWARTTRSTTGPCGCSPDKQQNWDTLDAVRDIASSIGATPSQVALSWLTNRPSVTAPIIGGEQPHAARGEPGRRRPRARRRRHQAPRRRQRPHPRRLPLRPVRREATRPLRRLQRAGHPRAGLRKVTVDWKDRRARRVVVGTDRAGRAVIESDEVTPNPEVHFRVQHQRPRWIASQPFSRSGVLHR